jgi:glyoxylase-like metal-dependent hydrolase (beta-lactamase superfamily II)
MKDKGMIQEIMTNLFRIEVPLPDNPLKSVNSYFIRGEGRDLIVDPGMNQKECMEVLQTCLKQLGGNLSKTDYFITHYHMDHLGLAATLATDESKIFLSQQDACKVDEIMYGNLWSDVIQFTVTNGFPEMELQEVSYVHPRERYRFNKRLVFEILGEDSTISTGKYFFKCVGTPGHTKGHMCLHEPNKKVFIAGDHILSEITPNISLRSDDENPLKEYFESLERVDSLKNIDLVLPGHGRPFKNYRERIKDLKCHYQQRLEEIMSVFRRGKQNAYQMASQIKWDINVPSWDQVPVFQKWFAVGEVIAHFKYLEQMGRIKKEMSSKGIVFSLQ